LSGRPRLVGVNHVAVEVGDVDEAVEFLSRVFDVTLRGRTRGAAFVDLGDQFLALSAGRTQPPDAHRHVGLVVDDREAVRKTLEEVGAEVLPGRGLNFRDPWGNRFQVVQYDEVQFTKTPHVLHGLGLEHLGKTEAAVEELRAKGMAPEHGVAATRAARYARGAMELGQIPQAELARLLREAEQAHGAYERELGHNDEDWPTWYAVWILEQLHRRSAGPDA
jgi:predicted enzyme related to lactoylglutathione lyase